MPHPSSSDDVGFVRPAYDDDPPVSARSLADEIAFRIERDIVGGTFSPGSRLPQDDLCARFGVSRTPVREALRKLQARNLVVFVPNKGATVRVPSRKELLDVYDVRAELEGHAAELAAARMTDVIVKRLDIAQARLEQLLEEHEQRTDPAPEIGSLFVATLEAANLEFHHVILDAAANDHLARLASDFGRMFPKDYVWRAMAGTAEMRSLNVLEHRSLRDTLAVADGARARREMREHVHHARIVLVRHLDQLGFWS